MVSSLFLDELTTIFEQLAHTVARSWSVEILTSRSMSTMTQMLYGLLSASSHSIALNKSTNHRTMRDTLDLVITISETKLSEVQVCEMLFDHALIHF